MKTFYKTVKILSATILVCLMFSSCASSKKCNCPAYSYNNQQNTNLRISAEKLNVI